MQSEILYAFRSSRTAKPSAGDEARRAFPGTGAEIGQDGVCGPRDEQELHPPDGRSHIANGSRDVAISFLRLANLDNEIVDRLSRYEAAVWRQLAQTLFTLHALKRR